MAYFAEINILKRVTRVIAVYDEDTQDENGNEVESDEFPTRLSLRKLLFYLNC